MVDYDIDKICRVCLRTNLELTLLFDERNAVEGVCLSEMITECTMYMVRRHDEFPHLICYDCIDLVRSAYKFKKQFEASHRKLISFLDLVPQANKANDKCIQTDESTLYPCEKCDEKFLDYGRLRDHRSESHKGTANLCRICPKTFSRIGDLKNHIAVCHPEVGHTTDNECKVCRKKFTRKDHVVRHLKNVHKLDSNELNASSMSIENLGETEIDYENLTNQDGDTGLLSNYDHEEYEDNRNDSPAAFEATNPFSSDEDEHPLSELRIAKVFNKIESQDGDTISIFKYDSGECEDDSSDSGLKDEQQMAELQNSKTSDEMDLEFEQTAIKPEPEDTSFNSVETNSNEKLSCESLIESGTDVKRKFKCTECDKVFTRSNHVKRHLASHRQEKPHACAVCGKRFSRSDHLKNHLTQHDTDKPFQCDICDRTYGRLDLLKRHKEQKHYGGTSNKCEHCNKSFSTKNYLQKHMRLHTEKKRLTCKYCALNCESKDSLKEHLKTHNREKPYLCSECGLRFVRNDYLLVHMRRHNGEKPYKCKYCGKGFPRTTDLNVHERYHTGEKSHLCPTCGKGFQRAYNLVVHMRVHTGEKPYQCPHCPRNFAQSNDLKAHIRRHTGERFRCDICGAAFIQAYNVTQHKFEVHGIEVESRIRRLVKFTSDGLTEKELLDVINEPDEQIKIEEMQEF